MSRKFTESLFEEAVLDYLGALILYIDLANHSPYTIMLLSRRL